MREIKFRAWDKVSKKMLPEIKELEIKHGNIVSLREPWSDFVEDAGYYEVMQFTGLTDKNGKEIYEEDIVTDDGGRKAEVMFRNGAFSWILLDGSLTWETFANSGPMFEVIGNVHENPDLIKNQ